MPISDLSILLRELRPELNDEIIVFCVLPPSLDAAPAGTIGTFREAEGTTVILEESLARKHGLSPLFRAAWITLSVSSDLNAVGLTAAVAGALAGAGISCNVVAAVHHDHLFVPAEAGEKALQVLEQLRPRGG